MKRIYTKGNVEVQNIKAGDIHYEFFYGMMIKCEVITTPSNTERLDYWQWQSKNLLTGKVIDYGVTEGLAHYSSNLYDYEAYSGCKQI
jgi:hypothetical protein